MAISKKTSTANTCNCECTKPNALYEIPHPQCPCPEPPMPITLWNSYDEAVNAVNDIHLKPGETHTEFYIQNGQYHCVVGIGNIKPNTKHLILVDNGGNDYNNDIKALKDNVNYILKALKDIDKKEDNIDSIINDLKDQISKISQTETQTVNDIKQIKVNITNITNQVNKNTSNITANTNNINSIISDLESVQNALSDLSNKVDTNTTNIKTNSNDIIDVKNNIDNILISIDELSDLVNQNILDISSNKEIIDNHSIDIQYIKDQLAIIDASIAALQNLSVNAIEKEYIDSLFHDDIYTVNLCCYTEAGHVEIIDKDGYDRSRVAECTPDNEYKTYVLGDIVNFKAVTNEGYTFKGWWRHGEDLHNANPYLDNIEFNESNICEPALGINLIGTLANGVERDILKNGYTALFGKRRRINIVKHIDPSEASLDNDKVIIKINGNIVKGPDYYFDDGDSVEIKAISQKPHKFDKFVINGIEYPYDYSSEDVREDLNVNAYFVENRYKIQAEPNEAYLGDILRSPDVNTIIEGGNIKLTAVPEKGIEFEKWIDEFSKTVSTDAILNLNNVSKDYNLVAVFKKSMYTVKFYDLTGEYVVDTKQIGAYETFGDELPKLPEAPAGYKADNWYLHTANPEQHELDVIINSNTPIKPDWDKNNDKVLHVYSHYIKL